MAAIKLATKRVEKPWGRRDLPPVFGSVPTDSHLVGEIWFENCGGKAPELLIKYLFTSEKLSIQVHPGDEHARCAGYPRGKDEAWVVLDAEPDATIGIGLKEPCSRDALRKAAQDGSIERLIDWRSVKAGDVYYSPAGTVHALGPGLKLVEIQQNVDLTYRLYDYGRPRELHLDAGIAVSDPVPYKALFAPYNHCPGRRILSDGPAFVLERWTRAAEGRLDPARPLWLAPLAGGGMIDGEELHAGSAWLVEGGAALSLSEGSDLLIAYTGSGVAEALLT